MAWLGVSRTELVGRALMVMVMVEVRRERRAKAFMARTGVDELGLKAGIRIWFQRSGKEANC
jgi:hypothetical protein